MKQIEALKELAEKVEADDVPKGFGVFADMFEGSFAELNIYFNAFTAYNGSLDAAHALHKAVLGDMIWCASIDYNHGFDYHHCVLDHGETGEEVFGSNMPNPARAWLLAIIKAKIQELEE